MIHDEVTTIDSKQALIFVIINYKSILSVTVLICFFLTGCLRMIGIREDWELINGIACYVRTAPGAVPDTDCHEKIDINTIERVSYSYFKDKNYVYWWSNEFYLVSDADSLTFERIGGSYHRDKHAVYHNGGAIKGSDRQTFKTYKIVSSSHPNKERDSEWASDKKYAYKFGATSFLKIKLKDPNTFTVLYSNWAKDSKTYYTSRSYRDEKTGRFKSEIIAMEEVDHETFEIITIKSHPTRYAKDKNHVYFHSEILSGADPKSFKVVNHREKIDVHNKLIWTAEDCCHRYFNDEIVEVIENVSTK